MTSITQWDVFPETVSYVRVLEVWEERQLLASLSSLGLP